METILIIYQQYNVHFHLKQDSDLKIALNGLKMDQLDQIWFQIKRKIQFKLTCCDISKYSCRIHFRITPSHFTQNHTMQGENGRKDIFQINIF